MKHYFKHYVKNFDYPLFVTYTLLCLFGLVMIYSASMVWAVQRWGYEPNFYYIKQLGNLALAFVAFFIFSIIPYHHYKKVKVYGTFVLIALVLLFAVKFVGYSPGNSGAKSWLNLGLSVQPSEIAKLAFILYFAVIFQKKEQKKLLNNFMTGYFPPFILLSVAALLIAKEPDFGGTALLLCITGAVVITSGVKFNTFAKIAVPLGIIMGGVIALALKFPAWFVGGKRVGRVEAFLNPFQDEEKFGYQVVNGYYAIGSGGLKGLGLGQSVQKLGYLPEPQTDFILAIIAEELGVFGVIVVLGGLFFLVARILLIAIRTKDSMARMFCTGVATWIGLQTFVNVGGLAGLIPLTGVPIPFISYGGTSVLLLSVALGIVANISQRVKSTHMTRKA